MNQSDRPSESQKAIDESLKKVYQETLDEDIPDRFVSLLQRLRGADQNKDPDADQNTDADQTSDTEEAR